MNTDQRNRFSKNICKSYKQNPDLRKTLAHPEFKDAAFLCDTVKGLVRSVMGNKHDANAINNLLNQIQTLPTHQQSDVAQSVFEVIGTKYFANNSLVQHSFDQVCAYGTCERLSKVLTTWAKSYERQTFISAYIAQAPDGWQKDIERSLLQDLAINRYPEDFFRFIPQIKSLPLGDVVGVYLKGFSRSPDHAMQEVERVLDHNTPDALLTFATILLERFEQHPTFHKWHDIVRSRHERMKVHVQHIVLSRHVNAVEHTSERHTRKI